MVRSLLSLLLALVLAAFGSSFALAQSEDDDPCAEVLAAAAQVEDDGEEFVDEGDDWADDEGDDPADDEEDWSDDDENYEDDDELGDEFDDELEDADPCEEIFDGEEPDEDSSEEDATTSSGRTRWGTSGDDRFIGDPGVNKFYGRGGNDYLDGAGGRDVLHGGPGNDKILTGKRKAGASKKRAKKKGADVKAGKGDDVVRSRNGRVDKIHCGKGRDSVLADRGDKVRTKNCETVRYG